MGASGSKQNGVPSVKNAAPSTSTAIAPKVPGMHNNIEGRALEEVVTTNGPKSMLGGRRRTKGRRGARKTRSTRRRR